jgi:hypothetical protein
MTHARQEIFWQRPLPEIHHHDMHAYLKKTDKASWLSGQPKGTEFTSLSSSPDSAIPTYQVEEYHQ